MDLVNLASYLVLLLAVIFFQGLGWGSERKDVATVSALLLIINMLARLIIGLSVNEPIVDAFNPSSVISAVLILVLDWGVGFLVGRAWYRRGS